MVSRRAGIFNKVSQRLDSTQPNEFLMADEGEAESLSLRLQSPYVSKASTDGPSAQWDVSICAPRSHTPLTRQVCSEELALRRLGF